MSQFLSYWHSVHVDDSLRYASGTFKALRSLHVSIEEAREVPTHTAG